MGKNKGRGRKAAYDETLSEVSSMMSVSSYNTNRSEDEYEDDSFGDEESKFRAFIDDIGNKSSKKSAPALKFIKSIMQGRPMNSLLSSQKETLASELYRALRKAKGASRVEILKCMAILFVSLDEEDSSGIVDEVMRELIPYLATKGDGKGVPSTLAIVSTASFNPNDVLQTTTCLRNVFKTAYKKGDGTVPDLKATQTTMIIECLEAWTFLIASVSTVPGFGRFVETEIDCVIDTIPDIFEQSNVELRIAAGEAIAVIYELSREYRGDSWEGFNTDDDILNSLTYLVKGVAVGGGSVNETNKKERKEQRHSFKQFLDYIQDDIPPQSRVYKINPQESLEIETFGDFVRYQMLCWCLEGGINSHMTFNELLRSDAWFGLGATLPQLTPLDKPSSLDKLRQRVIRGQQDKTRSNQRKKSRINAGDDHYCEYD